MSFGKLVWMLQTKQLWLSRADFLEDKFEVMLHGPQLNTVMTKRPTPALRRSPVSDELSTRC
jgi:hypothetical protein